MNRAVVMGGALILGAAAIAYSSPSKKKKRRKNWNENSSVNNVENEGSPSSETRSGNERATIDHASTNIPEQDNNILLTSSSNSLPPSPPQPPPSPSPLPSMPSWIIKTGKPNVLSFLMFPYLPTLLITIKFIPADPVDNKWWMILIYSTMISVIIFLVQWILSPPDRSVSKLYFQKPRVICLTGSASGMSQRLTEYFLKQGHFVCATDIRIDELKRQHHNKDYGGRLLLHKLDVCDPDAWNIVVSSIIASFGRIDVHFNIAGVLFPHKIQDATVREINMQVDVNVKGVIFGTKAVANAMKMNNVMKNGEQEQERKCGHIVNFSSMGGLATVSGVTLYAATKFAVRGFSMACSKDLSEHNIAVTCFMPDAVQTPMVDLQLKMEESAMAFSGEILSLDQVENAIVHDVIVQRPVEYWLSSRARLARFGDIFGASRAVALAEWFMKRAGIAKQNSIKQKLSMKEYERSGSGKSMLPDQRSHAKGSNLIKCFKGLILLWVGMMVHWWVMVDHTIYDTAEEIVSHHDVSGRTYLVTGASSGIGFETARVLVNGGARVLVASRSTNRGTAAVNKMNQENQGGGGGKAYFKHLDLGLLSSVDTLLTELKKEKIQLNGIVLNAGTRVCVCVCVCVCCLLFLFFFYYCVVTWGTSVEELIVTFFVFVLLFVNEHFSRFNSTNLWNHIGWIRKNIASQSFESFVSCKRID